MIIIIKSLEEVLTIVNTHITGTDEATLNAIGDITDTLKDMSNKASNADERLKKNDESWAQKYRDRFFGGSETEIETNIETEIKKEQEEKKPLTFDNLFKKGE